MDQRATTIAALPALKRLPRISPPSRALILVDVNIFFFLRVTTQTPGPWIGQRDRRFHFVANIIKRKFEFPLSRRNARPAAHFRRARGDALQVAKYTQCDRTFAMQLRATATAAARLLHATACTACSSCRADTPSDDSGGDSRCDAQSTR